MNVFRWILGVVSALLAAGAAGSLLIFLLMDIGVWLERARVLRRITFTVLLFWFNIEIWGRVVYTLVHW